MAKNKVQLFIDMEDTYAKLNDTGYVMETVTKSWDDLVQLLGRIFPDATEEDWDTVDLAEMVQVVKDFLLLKLKKLIGIPVDEKN